MLNGYQFRLYPDPAQQQILLRWIGCQRVVYNATVQEGRHFRRFSQRMVGTAGEKVPVDQEYSRFITERTVFLRQVPSQVLRNGAVRFLQAYQRFFQKLGGRQTAWLTAELFQFIPVTDAVTGAVTGYHLQAGTDKFPVGIIPYVAHRPHAPKVSIHDDGQGRVQLPPKTIP
ncbi:MAG: hypothetical protein C7B45_12305 [Sulfobacillus acidophilus]|uniref:Transposase putative helix-turn-helix domain-containing protein n=1 Tax=Sulfobacillus acidophilus TaxID=53633 RepID=A0A2T2WFS2_9FIRM|nr:MAG: hypothetical protein C7B45_12305 [Sulfobacillus acidophilus]